MNIKINHITSQQAPKAVGAYSHATQFAGFYFFSGQIGLDPIDMSLKDDFSSQLEQVLKNIDSLLDSTGLKKSDIIKTTIFLTNLKNFPLVNNAYEKYFTPPFPARSCVEVSRLPKDALVEIEVIAAKNN